MTLKFWVQRVSRNPISFPDNVRVSKLWDELNVVRRRAGVRQRSCGRGGRCSRGASCFLAQSDHAMSNQSLRRLALNFLSNNYFSH